MTFRLPVLALGLVILTAHSPLAAGDPDAKYAAIPARIFARIGALNSRFPAVDWSQEIKHAVVQPDGSASLDIEHRVTWVLDHPDQPASKLNGNRPVYQPGGFWIRLTFFRGPWKGAAVFRSIDFGDLHLWYEYGYKDDVRAVEAVSRIIEEERQAFDRTAAR